MDPVTLLLILAACYVVSPRLTKTIISAALVVLVLASLAGATLIGSLIYDLAIIK